MTKLIINKREKGDLNLQLDSKELGFICRDFDIFRKIKIANYKSKMILQIHDELLFECPEAEADRLGKMVQMEMEGAAKLSVPLKVDWNYGKSWYEAH